MATKNGGGPAGSGGPERDIQDERTLAEGGKATPPVSADERTLAEFAPPAEAGGDLADQKTQHASAGDLADQRTLAEGNVAGTPAAKKPRGVSADDRTMADRAGAAAAAARDAMPDEATMKSASGRAGAATPDSGSGAPGSGSGGGGSGSGSGRPSSGSNVIHASELTPRTQAGVGALLKKKLPPGGLDFGKYHLEKELGRGGMGVVYKALERSLNRWVALKLMLSEAVPEEERTRFLREAEASASLKHPYIVPVHEVNVEDGKLFFSMDYVEGKTLKSVIEEKKDDLRVLLPLFCKVCEAVGYAHRKGIIHRDLKPQNVMVDAELAPHVMDFGLAARVDDKEEAPTAEQSAASRKKAKLTRQGAIMGTPSYMPPEQAGGRTDEIDTRSDIYSLGVILYLILTGDMPHTGRSTPELLMSIEDDPPRPPRVVNARCPWELEKVVLKSIEKKREDRYQTAFDLAADLEAWLDGRPVSAVAGGFGYRAGKFVRRHRALVGIGAAAVVTIAGVTGYALRAAGAEHREAQAKAAGLFADAKDALRAGDVKRAEYEARRASLEPAAARQILEFAGRAYATAVEKFASAHQLDPSLAAPTDAAVAEQAVKGYAEKEVERQARADGEREARERARKISAEAAGKLAKLDPASAQDLAALEAVKAEIDAARGALLQALALDAESKAARDGLATTVVQKLSAAADAEKRLSQKERLDALSREADGEAVAARGAAEKDAAGARAHLRREIAALAEALRIAPEDSALRARRVDAALELGRLALAARQLELAEQVVDEVRDFDAQRVGAFLDVVKRARDDEGRYSKAIEAGALASAEEKWKEAAAAYQEALLAAAGRPEAEFGLRFARAGAAGQQGRHEEALSIYAEAAPFAASAVDKGALERGIARERAAVSDAEVAEAQAAVKESRYDDAGRHLARALEFKPDNATAARLSGEVEARRRVPAGMVLVADGPFTFGSGAGARENTPCAAFFIGKTEVTNKEYLAFVAAGGYERAYLWDAEARELRATFVGRDGTPGPAGWIASRPPEAQDDEPVSGVSWLEARAYARWKGAGWRLPTEVEWEKAATWDAAAGRKVDPPWLARRADGSVASAWTALWQPYMTRGESKPVGAPIGRGDGGAPVYDRSPADVLDMWGNVRELVVVQGEGAEETAGLRGGSFSSRFEERSTAYGTHRPKAGYRALDVGFRVAKKAVEGGAK